jgi:hypothetical protein
MISEKIIVIIDDILQKLKEEVADKYKSNESNSIVKSRCLNELKSEVQSKNRFNQIPERIIRSKVDLGIMAFKDFENSPCEVAINKLSQVFYENISGYLNIVPLGDELGKEEPF